MDCLNSLFYNIGNIGPIFLIFLSCFLLWNKKNLLYYYLIGVFLNTIINIILKGYIQQPRPLDDDKLFKIALKNCKKTIFKNGTPYDVFGMPSGHAQSCFYTTFFILFSLKNMYVFTLFLFFSLGLFLYISI